MRTLSFDDVNRVVRFIINTFEEIDWPYPAAPKAKRQHSNRLPFIRYYKAVITCAI